MSDLLDLSPPGQLSNDSLAGAKAYFYNAGTTSLRTVYSDSGLSVPHPSPLQADADGLFAQVFVSGAAVKVVVTDADDGTLYTLDPAPKISASGSGASSISFAPTAEIAVSNVQAAIEAVQANIAAPLADFGLGVTGSATLLANIDATNIASGAYRFDATTTGTFPSGIAASVTGVVETWREVAGASLQFLYPETSDRIFFRRYTSAAWQTWIELASDANAGVANASFTKTAVNASGSAPIYACRAWVNFNGTGTPAIRASGNVSSITDNGTGDYTVNFTTDPEDADYAVCCLIGPTAGTVADSVVATTLVAGSVRIQTSYLSGTTKTLADYANISLAIFR